LLGQRGARSGWAARRTSSATRSSRRTGDARTGAADLTAGQGTNRSSGENLFRAALLVKGLDGAVELLAALALAFGSAHLLDGLVQLVLDHHLLGGPHSALAERFATGEEHLVGSDRTFAVVYLLLHGLTKCGLVIALARRIRPAYPVAVVVLGGFVGYEIYRAVQTGSVLLPVLAAIDVLVIVLVIREYRRLGPVPEAT
jgi:uncharacterized membrane protein